MNAFMKFNKGEVDKDAGKPEGKFLALALAEGSKVRFLPTLHITPIPLPYP